MDILALEQTLIRFRFAQPDVAADDIGRLLEAVFGPADGETALAWTLATDEDLDPTVEAALLRLAREAGDPLAHLANAPTLRTRLNALMRQKWASRNLRAEGVPVKLRGLHWNDLNPLSQGMVRDGITHLEALAQRPRRRGPHQDHRLDTFLNELAEIYARHTGSTAHQLEVPSAETSRFIKLAVEVLKSTGVLTQDSPKTAIAQRWKRYKRAHRRGQCD